MFFSAPTRLVCSSHFHQRSQNGQQIRVWQNFSLVALNFPPFTKFYQKHNMLSQNQEGLLDPVSIDCQAPHGSLNLEQAVAWALWYWGVYRRSCLFVEHLVGDVSFLLRWHIERYQTSVFHFSHQLLVINSN